jgi:hypothetical protein
VTFLYLYVGKTIQEILKRPYFGSQGLFFGVVNGS